MKLLYLSFIVFGQCECLTMDSSLPGLDTVFELDSGALTFGQHFAAQCRCKSPYSGSCEIKACVKDNERITLTQNNCLPPRPRIPPPPPEKRQCNAAPLTTGLIFSSNNAKFESAAEDINTWDSACKCNTHLGYTGTCDLEICPRSGNEPTINTNCSLTHCTTPGNMKKVVVTGDLTLVPWGNPQCDCNTKELGVTGSCTIQQCPTVGTNYEIIDGECKQTHCILPTASRKYVWTETGNLDVGDNWKIPDCQCNVEKGFVGFCKVEKCSNAGKEIKVSGCEKNSALASWYAEVKKTCGNDGISQQGGSKNDGISQQGGSKTEGSKTEGSKTEGSKSGEAIDGVRVIAIGALTVGVINLILIGSVLVLLLCFNNNKGNTGKKENA